MRNLGYRPEYDLERGVKETIAWYKDKGWFRLIQESRTRKGFLR